MTSSKSHKKSGTGEGIVPHRGRHRSSVPDGVFLGAELQQGTEV